MLSREKLSELQENGYCVLKAHFSTDLIRACKDAFWPLLLTHLDNHGHEPNRGPHRHFMPMPFEPPCFAPTFFFDTDILTIVRGAMDERIVADLWGCDTSVRGSQYQGFHRDYRRPLFAEVPDLPLPPYVLLVSFGLISITPAHGPIEIAPRTHRMKREESLGCLAGGDIEAHSVPLEIGDVLIWHPWAIHRGTPNTTDTPRPVVTIRYVRRWYADCSRDVKAIPKAVWESLTEEQKDMMRFPNNSARPAKPSRPSHAEEHS